MPKFRVRSRDLMGSAAPVAGIMAAFVNTLVFFAASLAGFISPSVLIMGDSLNAVQIMVASFIPVMVAALVLRLLSVLWKNPWPVFRILTVVLLLVSLSFPFLFIPSVPLPMAFCLDLMHAVTAFLILYYFKEKALVSAP